MKNWLSFGAVLALSLLASLLALAEPARAEKRVALVIGNNDYKNVPKLQKAVNDARKTGLAFEIEEHDAGVCGVGVAFDDMLGNGLAISVSIPTARFERIKSLVCESLLGAKAKLDAAFSRT